MEDFSGVSSTFRRFSIGIMKTEQLLKLGLLAVQEDKRKLDELYNKIDMQVSQQTSLPHPGNEGGDPQEDESAFEVISHTNETVTLKMGEKTANLILEALRRQQKFTDELNFHLHNILLVSIWSAFETYLQGVLSEIYQHRPHLLASERKLNYSELIENRADILKYMIDTEIGDFGRRSFQDMQKYIKNRVKFQWADELSRSLGDIYILRNFIAHNSGFVRPSQEQVIPKGLPVEEGELRIPIEYLRQATDLVRAAVQSFENVAARRWMLDEASNGQLTLTHSN